MLTALLSLPVLGAGAVALLPVRRARLAWRVALAASLATLAFAFLILSRFDASDAGVQFAESHVWNERMGTAFAFGVDGLSLPLVLLTAVLVVAAVLASAKIVSGAKLYFFLVLLLESAVLGVFTARDWSLFYVFWELTLIPLFFLIDRLGGENRHRAALNFVLYTMGGSVFILIALLLLYDASPSHSFRMAALAAGAQSLPLTSQLWILGGLLIGFGVKMPIVPLHGWVRLAYGEAPGPVPIILSGVLAKMGAYGLLRAAATLPAAMEAIAGWLAAFAFVSMLYGGVLAWRQRDIKAMAAYASVSHMGVVLLGLAALNVAGISGAVMQMLAHGFVAGALFLAVHILVERTGRQDIADYGSLSASMPRFAVFLTLAFVAGIGLPGTAGFVAELHALAGGLSRWGFWVALLSLSVLVTAAYSLRTIGRLTTGPALVGLGALPDLSRSELAAALLLAAGILALGLVPAPALALVSASVAQLAGLFAP